MKVINGHTIFSFIDGKYNIKCGNCGRHTSKSISGIYRSTKCRGCQDIIIHHYAGRTISQWCYILGLKKDKIYNRLRIGWTIKQALFQHKRIFIESFDEKDLNYISKFYTSRFQEDKELEKKAEQKYKKKNKI